VTGPGKAAVHRMTPEQKRQNQRLAWILASIALVLFLGFIAKAALFGI
jgi:hypothetical protein